MADSSPRTVLVTGSGGRTGALLPLYIFISFLFVL